MRVLIGLLVVLVLGGLGWFLVGMQPDSTSAAATREERDSKVETHSETAELSVPQITGTSQDSRVRAPVELEVANPEAAVGTDTASSVTVRGNVVLVEANGNRLTDQAGSLRVVHNDPALDDLEVRIEAGQFSFETEDQAVFEIRGVEIAGVDFGLGEPAVDIVAVDEWVLELELYGRVRAKLSVRDRASGQDLAGVELWNRADWSYFPSLEPTTPAESQVGQANHVSPINLPTRDGKQTWWVRAEGYAWAVVEFDHRFGGERIALLDPEATLIVRIANRPASESLVVVLVRGEFGSRTLSREVEPSHPSELRIEGLEAGTLEVKVARMSDSNLRSFDSKEVELRIGEVTEVNLSALVADVESSKPRMVSVSGTLELPPGIVREPSLLMCKWIGEGPEPEETDIGSAFERIEKGGNLWSWVSDEFAPGLWQVRVTPFGYAQELLVGPNGLSGVALRVPHLSELRIRVRDLETGIPLSGASVSWNSILAEVESFEGHIQESKEPGVYLLSHASQEIRVTADLDGYGGEWDLVLATGGDSELLLEMSQQATVTITLKEGTTIVRREIPWWIEVESECLDGEGYIRSRSFDGSASMTAGVTKPGLYLLTFGQVDGYLPIEPLEVLFEKGIRSIEVQLIRE